MYYTVYTHKISMQPDSAHEIHDVMCANAAANLGYPTVIVYPNHHEVSYNFFKWVNPFNPQSPSSVMKEFFNLQDRLRTVELPKPWPSQYLEKQKLNYDSLVYHYYLPYCIFPKSKIIHTRSWNCVKVAVKNKIPVIYEKHYFQDSSLEAEIAKSPFLKLAITQSEMTRNSLIDAGMPEEKTVWMHNGFSPSFLERQLEEAYEWRQELLKNARKHLVVYSGALYRFKGIDMLIDVAKELPEIQFALTGGTEEQVQSYRQIAREKQVENICFLGWILPRSRLVSLLQAADILAHPHCSGKAADITNPVKFFQYLGSGTPLVVTEILPLMIFKEAPLAASWCEPDNPQAFAQAILHTLQTYPRKPEGYQENLKYAQQFTWEERTQKIITTAQISFDD